MPAPGMPASTRIGILALQDPDLAERLEEFRRAQERRALDMRLPDLS